VPADAIGDTSATVSNLTENTAYEFKLTAHSTTGSAAAPVIRVTTKIADAAQQDNVPNDVQIRLTAGKETSSVTIEWKAAADDTADVKVQYVIEYTYTDAKDKVITKKVTVSPKKGVQAGDVITKDLKLKAGTTYTFAVYAKGARGVADSVAASAGTITTYAVVPKAALATISKKDALPDWFKSESMIAARVSNYYAANSIGNVKKQKSTDTVDTVTITYTFGKTKADKMSNSKSVTLKWDSVNQEWTGGGNVSLTVGDDGRAYIIVTALTEIATKYTLAVQFSNEAEGQKATSTAATSKTIATTKLNWKPVTRITSSADSQNASVSWAAARDSEGTLPDTVYTVKIWTEVESRGQMKMMVKTFTVKASQYTIAGDTASWALTASQAKIFANVSEYWVTVTPRADKLHVAGTETAPAVFTV
ncbi:MAG: fibronectin type III domain-containing protein, partial [Planctomycetaceae bacterium]|nr:fibronectin type III domain-containing protein [Planctomycetaceae bacterium]